MKRFLLTSSFVLPIRIISFLLHITVIISLLVFGVCSSAVAQDEKPYIRIVNIVVDSAQLDSFKAALKKDIEASVPTEPGTLTLHAVYDKDNPTHVTVFEIYTSKEAHLAHQQTPHFSQYKNATKDMVKSTERFEMIPIVLEAKPLSDP